MEHVNGSLYTDVEATAAALMAGTDLNCGSQFSKNLPIALSSGLVSLSAVNTAAYRALKGHMELGLFQDSYAQAKDFRRKFPMDIVDSAEHRALSKRAAIEGTVLLKNRDGALPLLHRSKRSRSVNGRLKVPWWDPTQTVLSRLPLITRGAKTELVVQYSRAAVSSLHLKEFSLQRSRLVAESIRT